MEENETEQLEGQVSTRDLAKEKKVEELKETALDYLRSCKADMDVLQGKREKMFKEYMGEPYGNEIKGRSQVVSTDIADTVEWIMPALMKIFYGGKEVVNIAPQGNDDVEKAKLMEVKVNFDFQKSNPGFTILYDWFKDAMLFKLGVVKYWWEKREEYDQKFFENLTEEAVLALQSIPDFIIDEISYDEIQSVTVQPDPMTGMPVEVPYMAKSYHIKGREVRRISKPCVQNVPPEEFVFNIKDRYVGETFCAHKKTINKKEAVKYGLSEDDIKNAEQTFATDPVYQKRFDDLGGVGFLKANEDEVFIYECYVWEYDERGNKHPKILTIIGDKVVKIQDNSYGKPNFATLTPIRMAHRVCGRSMAEIVSDIQKIKTSLMRFMLDNLYFQNNGMKVVNPYRINIDDLMFNNHPGGIVKTLHDTEPSQAIHNIQPTPLPAFTPQIFEMIEGMKENRTGVTRYNQGIDAGSLNKTASGITQIMSAAQQRIELIARIFAETGVKELFEALVEMNIDYFDTEQLVKVDEAWKAITPDDIKGEFDTTVEVGIGLGHKEMMFNQMMNMLNVYGMAMNTGAFQMKPDKMNNMLREMWTLIGFKNAERFLPEPGQMPIPPGAMQQMGAAAQMPSSERNMDMSQGGMLGLQ